MSAREARRAKGQITAAAKRHPHSNPPSHERLRRENQQLLRENEELRRKLTQRDQQLVDAEKQIANSEEQIAKRDKQIADAEKQIGVRADYLVPNYCEAGELMRKTSGCQMSLIFFSPRP
jgi:hypothetical protein